MWDQLLCELYCEICMAEPLPEGLNFDEELRLLARAEPFAPFEIVTASGDKYEVTDSWQVAMGENAIVLVLPKTGVRVVRKSLITALHSHLHAD